MNLSIPNPDELKEAASAIEAFEGEDISPYFKLELILILAGEKAVTETEIHFRDETSGKPQEIKKNLEALGFECELGPVERVNNVETVNNLVQWIYVARSRHDIQQLKEAWQAGDSKKRGELYGFPASAISTYSSCSDTSKGMIGPENLPDEAGKPEWAPFCRFMLSRENWREEIKTPQRWHDIIRTYAPELYKRIMSFQEFRISKVIFDG